MRVGSVALGNPVVAASGCFGFGAEYGEVYDISRLGAICTKGLTLQPRTGNPPPRLWETSCGMLNSIGLENPGVEAFLREELPRLKETGAVVIANVWGASPEEYEEIVQTLASSAVDAIELNLSCPNVPGKKMPGRDAAATAEIVGRAHDVARGKPLWAKLPPEAPAGLVAVAQAAQDAGAEAVCAVNSFPGLAVDIRTGRPVFANVVAGLSGPAIKPLALRIAYELTREVDVPVVGIGGITTWEDALEFIMAGAHAVQIGTANFVNPCVGPQIVEGLREFLDERGIRDWEEIRGCAHR
ncbi:TPA: dihydroorotate dehydrogenase [Candidatus Acetothermia bacterium]|nr:dihydroorotate dehydrogenase [Candidatus Acetothermia bacterium]HAZ30188.1 dihydroorotate dehydrogenase [Candidatus Acetothermia bacterium]